MRTVSTILVPLLLVGILLSTLSSPLQSSSAQNDSPNTGQQQFDFVTKWGSHTDHALLYASKISTDPIGNLYVINADVRDFRIQKYDPSGMPVAEIGSSSDGFEEGISAGGIASDPTGEYVYVSSTAGKMVKFNSNGTFVKEWGSLGTGDGQFSQFMEGVATDGHGNVYVADAGNARIQKFSPEGVFIAKWGSDGSGDGQFAYPYGIAIGQEEGSIYVNDLGNRRIEKFSPEGVFQLKWSPGGDPVGMSVGPEGDVYIVAQSTDKVKKFSPDGQFISQFNGTVFEPGLYSPLDVAVDANGNIYTAINNAGVQKFDGDGNFISYISVTKEGIGNFRGPAGIATDANGDVYVLDNYDLRVQRFTGSGDFVSQWSVGIAPGNEDAYDIDVADSGNIIVVWEGVKEFTPDGKLVRNWGPVGDGPGEIIGPKAISVDRHNDRIYVASPYRIQQYAGNGTYLSEWMVGDTGEVSGQGVSIDDIAVDSEGMVYALGFSTNVVEVFAPDGTPVTSLDFSSEVPEVELGGMIMRANVFRIAIDDYDNLYVGYIDGTIREYDISGNFIEEVASRGMEDGQVTFPTGIAFKTSEGSSNLVYVADGGNYRVQVFATESKVQNFVPDYQIVEGDYVNNKLGFSFTLPEGMKGYLTDSNSTMYSGDDFRFIGIQIHPDFNSTDPSSCCPVIDTAPAVMIFESGSVENLKTPVPITGDLFAAFEGYRMRMHTETLGSSNKTVLVSELHPLERPEYQGSERIGKFYLLTDDTTYISYGILGSKEGYAEHLADFEESARSLAAKNMTTVDLGLIFKNHLTATSNITLSDGSTILPRVMSSGPIEQVRVDESANSLGFKMNESQSDNGIFIFDSSQILEGPLSASVDGKVAESDDLKTEKAHYLVVYYDAGSPGDRTIVVTGTRVVPEFPVLPITLALAMSTLVYLLGARRFGDLYKGGQSPL